MTYCKPGDLAVVVKAHNISNIGTIVHVIGLYTGQSDLCAPAGDVIWEAQASHPMTYDTAASLRGNGLPPSRTASCGPYEVRLKPRRSKNQMTWSQPKG